MGTQYAARVGFTGPSPASRVQALLIFHRVDGEIVGDVEKENLTLAEAAALCVRWGCFDIRENTLDERALAKAISDERYRVLKEAEEKAT